MHNGAVLGNELSGQAGTSCVFTVLMLSEKCRPELKWLFFFFKGYTTLLTFNFHQQFKYMLALCSDFWNEDKKENSSKGAMYLTLHTIFNTQTIQGI